MKKSIERTKFFEKIQLLEERFKDIQEKLTKTKDLLKIEKIRTELKNIYGEEAEILLNEKLFEDEISVQCIPDIFRELEKIKKDLDKKEKELKEKEKALENFIVKQKDTFALPSNSVMIMLLLLFMGESTTGKIPLEAFNKTPEDRTKEEKKELKTFVDSIIKEDVEYLKEIDMEVKGDRYAIVCKHEKLKKSKAYITDYQRTFFKDDITIEEENLARYINKTFGAEGLRHFLALIIGLEENFREGSFKWTVNSHLKRLGYRKENRSYKPELKKMAIQIIKLFSNLILTVERREGEREKISKKKLFMLEGMEIEKIKDEVLNEGIKLVASSFWYQDSFKTKSNQTQKYTKLLKKIVKENHREHKLTILLAPLFAIFWRMNQEKREFTIKNLMNWCNLKITTKHKKREIQRIESELEYMKKKGYLGDWKNKTEKKEPSKCKNPLDCVLQITPPKWLKEELVKIKTKKDKLIEAKTKEKEPLLTIEEFRSIVDKSGLTKRDFASKLGISRQMVSGIYNGKRKITKKISKEIKTFFKNLFTP